MREYPDLAAAITAALPTRRFGRALRVYDRVASTNDVARDLADAGAAEGTAVLALEQTRGRGRRGRAWISPRGGIYLSVVTKPSLPQEQWALIGYAVAVGAAVAAESAAGVRMRLKWPNDLMVDDGKVGGILAEAWGTIAVAGIGMNANVATETLGPGAASFPLDDAGWVSLVRAILCEAERHYDVLQSDPRHLLDAWRARSMTLGRRVIVTGAVEAEGLAEDVAEDGALLVRTDAGLLRVLAGDVTVRNTADTRR